MLCVTDCVESIGKEDEAEWWVRKAVDFLIYFGVSVWGSSVKQPLSLPLSPYSMSYGIAGTPIQVGGNMRF